ncbi:MAG: hypothetical protein ACE5GM_07035 [bacterium]
MSKKFDWERFDEWKEDWLENSEKEKLKHIQELAKAEQDYRKLREEPKQLRPRSDPKAILGVRSSEPGRKKLPLCSLEGFPLSLPVDSTETSPAGLTVKFSKTSASARSELEDLAYHFKKAAEVMMGERLILAAVLQETGQAAIREVGEDTLFTIAKTADEGFIITPFTSKPVFYSHRYYFDLADILRKYGDFWAEAA